MTSLSPQIARPLSAKLWPGFLIALCVPLALSLFSPLPFAFFVPVTALAGLMGVRLATGGWPDIDWPLYRWVAALCALALLSTWWSVDPQGTFERALKTSALLLASLPLLDLARRCPPGLFVRYGLVIPALLLIISLGLSAEILLHYPIYRLLTHQDADSIVYGSYLNKNVAVFVLVLPVALLICARAQKYALALLLVLASALLLVLTESQAAQLAFIVIMLAWGMHVILPVAGIPLVFATLAVLLCLMPWIAPIAFDTLADKLTESSRIAARASSSARLENWDFISRKIIENPWRGFGMDATRAITDFKSEKLYFASNRIMHPHNFALQVWIEFGLPGVILTCGFLGFILRRLLKLPRPGQRLPFAIFCGGITFLFLSWSMWSAWLLALYIYLSAGLLLAANTTPAPATSSPPQ